MISGVLGAKGLAGVVGSFFDGILRGIWVLFFCVALI